MKEKWIPMIEGGDISEEARMIIPVSTVPWCGVLVTHTAYSCPRSGLMGESLES